MMQPQTHFLGTKKSSCSFVSCSKNRMNNHMNCTKMALVMKIPTWCHSFLTHACVSWWTVLQENKWQIWSFVVWHLAPKTMRMTAKAKERKQVKILLTMLLFVVATGSEHNAMKLNAGCDSEDGHSNRFDDNGKRSSGSSGILQQIQWNPARQWLRFLMFSAVPDQPQWPFQHFVLPLPCFLPFSSLLHFVDSKEGWRVLWILLLCLFGV